MILEEDWKYPEESETERITENIILKRITNLTEFQKELKITVKF